MKHRTVRMPQQGAAREPAAARVGVREGKKKHKFCLIKNKNLFFSARFYYFLVFFLSCCYSFWLLDSFGVFSRHPSVAVRRGRQINCQTTSGSTTPPTFLSNGKGRGANRNSTSVVLCLRNDGRQRRTSRKGSSRNNSTFQHLNCRSWCFPTWFVSARFRPLTRSTYKLNDSRQFRRFPMTRCSK